MELVTFDIAKARRVILSQIGLLLSGIVNSRFSTVVVLCVIGHIASVCGEYGIELENMVYIPSPAMERLRSHDARPWGSRIIDIS